MRVFLVSMLLLIPFGTSAAVSISEVAWMGSSESANYEWIELHNDGEAVDVTGWLLKDGMNLEIELVGTIPANTYVVLERTSDDSAPGAAFLIYTGALVNTGATLQLLRGDSSLVDQVPGGENWVNIGGDNVTKETAQYTSSGWKTAQPTPGRGLVWSEELEVKTNTVAEETTKTSSATVIKKSANSSESVRLTVPGVTLSLKVNAQTVGYVHQPISFLVKPSGIGDTLIDSLTYQWNFGDGLTSTNKDPQHIFQYPGTYVVTVYAGFKRQEQVARHEITILPVKVSLTTNDSGDVQVNNDSPYELDLSGYRLRGEKLFTFPPYSILLPNQTITISKNKIGQTSSRMVALYDNEITLVSSISPHALAFVDTHSAEMETLQPQISTLSSSRQSVPVEANAFMFAPTASADEGSELKEEVSLADFLAISSQTANVSDVVAGGNSRFEYLALVGVLGLAIVGVYAAPRRKENFSKMSEE